MPSIPRRSVLTVILTVLLAGCVGETRGGRVLAKLSDPPAGTDPTPYPQSGAENPYITKALDEALEADEELGFVSAEVPPEDFPETKQTVNEYRERGGGFVRYKDETFELTYEEYE